MRRSVGSSCDHEVVLRCPPCGRQGNQVRAIGKFGVEVGDDLEGVRRTTRGTSAPGVAGRKATTNEGRAGVFATEAKEGGAGREAGVRAGVAGGWARGLGVGWAEGFLAAAALGGGPEPLTFAASSLTWPASEAKAISKEVRRSRSSSWGREGGVGGGEEGGGGWRSR